MKLQQAYYSESNAVGGWTLIGYTAPNGGQTTNFNYGEAWDHGTTVTSMDAAVVGFAADNRVTLNDCAAGTAITASNATNASTSAHWYVTVQASTATSADVTFDAKVATDCEPLTTTFGKIGK